MGVAFSIVYNLPRFRLPISINDDDNDDDVVVNINGTFEIYIFGLHHPQLHVNWEKKTNSDT